MSDKIVDAIASALHDFDLPDVETIVAGIDEVDGGVHIYSVLNDEVTFNDSVGFSAIGSGYWHANSHFMLSKYSKSVPEDKALATIHAAKKKAEDSPGVGRGTDMFILGPRPGSFTLKSLQLL